MTTPIGDLQAQVALFADETADLLRHTLPGMPEPPVETITIEDRYVIRTGEGGKGVPLFVDSEQLATLTVSFRCRLDSVKRYLAVETSNFILQAKVDRTPVIRFDFNREMHTVPNAHIQVHAHRGALSHLLSKAGHSSPHEMSSLHIPVGGSRFRPCLEDVVQFLIQEIHFDSMPEWQDHVRGGRERWRRRQVSAVVRDVPDEAVRVLRELGYEVREPEVVPQTSRKALENW